MSNAKVDTFLNINIFNVLTSYKLCSSYWKSVLQFNGQYVYVNGQY